MGVETLLITQARLGSARLPGKVLMTINNESLLKIHIDRIKRSRLLSEIVVATTNSSNDEIIFQRAIEWGVKAFRGSEDDVLDRYYRAAMEYDPKWIVRVTSDCPLIDPVLLDEVIAFVQNANVDYGANILLENFPDGQDIEVFTFATLKKAWNEATKRFEREHVTPYIRNNSTFKGGALFESVNFPCEANFSKIRMTVDEPKDFEVIKELITALGVERSWLEYADYMIKNKLTFINENIIRNEGYLKSLDSERHG